MTGSTVSMAAVVLMIATVLFAGVTNWLITAILVEGVIFEAPRDWLKARSGPKMRELLSCQLCMGVWVGLLMGLLVPGPFALWVLNGLLYKALGHLFLEIAMILRYQVARMKPVGAVYHDDVGPLANARVLREASAIASVAGN